MIMIVSFFFFVYECFPLFYSFSPPFVCIFWCPPRVYLVCTVAAFSFLVFLSVSLVSVGFPFLGPIFVDGPFFQLLGLFFSYCFCISVPNDFCIQNVFIS